jgi:hypothetical protein
VRDSRRVSEWPLHICLADRPDARRRNAATSTPVETRFVFTMPLRCLRSRSAYRARVSGSNGTCPARTRTFVGAYRA